MTENLDGCPDLDNLKEYRVIRVPPPLLSGIRLGDTVIAYEEAQGYNDDKEIRISPQRDRWVPVSVGDIDYLEEIEV